MNDALGARLALDHLVELGHRRIAQIGGPAGIEPAERRARAFAERAAELGLGDIPVVHADFLEQDGAAGVDALLAQIRTGETAELVVDARPELVVRGSTATTVSRGARPARRS
jgi:DNA-binding LacI/PurR family transcriptional regulator